MQRQVSYFQARLLLLALGTVLAVGQTLVAWERGAAPTEVLAPALYIPVFAGAVLWFLPGGLIAAAFSSLVYGVLLAEQAGALGLGLFTGLLLNRIATYVFYGVVVAVAAKYLEGRLRKLEMHDKIDDLTGLYNSAFLLETVDLEVERAKRYRTLFSVAVLDIDREAFNGRSKRAYAKILRDLARRIQAGPRSGWDDPFYHRHTDLAIRVDDGSRDRFLFILPETPPEGAQVFSSKVHDGVSAFLAERGCAVDSHLQAQAVTFPEDGELVTLARRFREPGDQGAQARVEFASRLEREPLWGLREQVAQVEARRRSIRQD